MHAFQMIFELFAIWYFLLYCFAPLEWIIGVDCRNVTTECRAQCKEYSLHFSLLMLSILFNQLSKKEPFMKYLKFAILC